MADASTQWLQAYERAAAHPDLLAQLAEANDLLTLAEDEGTSPRIGLELVRAVNLERIARDQKAAAA